MTESPNTTSPCEFYSRLSRWGCPYLRVQKEPFGLMLMPRTGHDCRGCHSKGSVQRMMGPGRHPHLGRLAPTPYFSVPLSFRGALLPRPQTLPRPDFTTLAFSPTYPTPPPPWRQSRAWGGRPHLKSSPLHTEWEGDPGISANTTSVVEYRDPMAVFCHTNVTDATRIQWYVNALNVSSNEQMTISPDRKTLTLHQLSRYDFTIRCGIENVLGLPQKSDFIFPKVFCKCSGESWAFQGRRGKTGRTRKR